MAQDTAEKSILEKLAQTQTFHPAGAKLFVPDWTLDPGDVVTVTSKKDVHDPDEEPTEYKVPIYSMDLTWNGKSRLDIQSTGNQEREPLSALRRKEYQTGRRGYGMQKEIEEETQQQYEHYTEQTDAYRKEIYRVNGVVYDSNGNIVYQTDPVTGEYILDNAGNKIPVYNPESNGSISGQVIQSAQRMATIIKQSGTVYEVFSETKQYYEGDRVLYPDSNGIPYKFINDHNPGPWKGDGEHGDVVSLGTLQSQIDNNTENFNIFYGDVNERLGTIEGSTLWGNADELVAINGRIRVENNKVIIEEGGGIVTERTVSGRTVQSGIWDAGNLTAGTIVQTINGTTETTIRADKVNLEGYVTASYVDTAVLLADSLTSDDGYIGNIKASNINTGGNINASGAVYGSGIYITSTSEQGQTIYTDLSNAVKTIQKNDDAPDGQIGIKFNTFGNATWIPINFNIADTAKYKADVGISSVDPGNWQYDSTEHKYYNPVVATAKDSTQENPDTMTANVFIPDITLTPVVNGLTYIGKVNAWGPSVSGTVYAAADELSLYLKEKDNYVYITKTDSDPVTVGPNSNVVARMEIQGGSGVDPKVSKSEWQNGSTTFTAGTSGQSSIPVSLSIVPTTNWSAATVPVNPTFRIDDGQSSTGLTGTFRLQVDNDYVYVKSNTDNPVIGTNVLARQTNTAYADGQRSVSADFINVETQSAVTTLQAGDYGLYRTINGTAETNPIRYYRVAAGGGSSYYSTFLDKITLSNEDIGDSVQKYSVANYSDGHRDSEAKTRVVIDASAVYSAGVTAGLGGVVNVEKQPWDGNTCEFKPSAGEGTSASVTITAEPTKVSLASATSTGEIVLKDGDNQFATKNLYLRQRTLNGQNYVVLTDTSSIVSVGNVLAKYSASGGGTGETRSVYNISNIVLSPADIGPSVTKYPTLYYDDETDDNTIPIYIDASAVYRRGQQDGAGISILENYSTTIDSNNTTVTLLPSEKGDYNVMASASVTVSVPPVYRLAQNLAQTIVLPATHTGIATINNNQVEYDLGPDTGNFPVVIDASAVYTAGVSEGAMSAGYTPVDVWEPGTENKFSRIDVPTGTTTVNAVTGSGALYQVNSNGSLYLCSVEVPRTVQGYLYQNNGSGFERVPGTGNGSWFYVDGNVTRLMRASNLKVASASTTQYTVATGSRTAYITSSSGTVSFWTAPHKVSNKYYIRST